MTLQIGIVDISQPPQRLLKRRGDGTHICPRRIPLFPKLHIGGTDRPDILLVVSC